MSYSSLATIDARTGCGGHYSPSSYRKGYDYIALHHNASTNFDAVPGVWENRAASAHYQVGPSAIKVCLDEELVSWNAGSWDANTRSIAIENVNSTGAPDWKVAPETQENTAKLVADICQRRGIPIDTDHIKPHSFFSPTACPGGLDVNWIINRAKELSGQPIDPVTNNTPSIVPTPQHTPGKIYFDYRGRVREHPSTSSATMRIYDAGTEIDYDGYVHGEYVNGTDLWLRTSLHKWYVSASVTGGVFALPYLGDDAVSVGKLVPQNGTFRAYYNMKIRTSPTTQESNAIDTFSAGATHSYDNYIDNDGYRWISFIGDTTKKRVYVARRKLDNSEVFGECY